METNESKILLFNKFNNDSYFKNSNIFKMENFDIYMNYYKHCIKNNLSDNCFDDIYFYLNKIFDLFDEYNIDKTNFYYNLFNYSLEKNDDAQFYTEIDLNGKMVYLMMYLLEEDDIYVKSHEFGHLLSYKFKNLDVKNIDNKNIITYTYSCGFSNSVAISDNGGELEENYIGVGLTEAVNDFIVSLLLFDGNLFKCIDEDNVLLLCYMVGAQYIRALSDIIGNDIIIKKFFSADLEGLIEEISKYTEKNEVLKFVEDMDYVSQIKENMKDELSYDDINITLNNCNNFLRELSLKKYGKVICEDNLVTKITSDYLPFQIEKEVDIFFENKEKNKQKIRKF